MDPGIRVKGLQPRRKIGALSVGLENQVHPGDNLPFLRDQIDDACVDLVYLDPPFNSHRSYKGSKRDNGNSPPGGFDDRWRWDGNSGAEVKRIATYYPELGRILASLVELLGNKGMLTYLTMMAPRLWELRRVLKEYGSLFLHCDQSASAWLRVLLDSIFGADNFLNEIVWCYGLGGSSRSRLPRKHDLILWFARQRGKHRFYPPLIPASSQRMKGQLKKMPDYWNIPSINNMAHERTGWPTQKPLALLERLIGMASKPGDLVLDPFCGSGTTLVAAARLDRRWLGIDSSPEAVALARKRLQSLS